MKPIKLLIDSFQNVFLLDVDFYFFLNLHSFLQYSEWKSNVFKPYCAQAI